MVSTLLGAAMVKAADKRIAFFFLVSVAIAGIASAVPYDYSATTECLAEPLKPQYGGGILASLGYGTNHPEEPNNITFIQRNGRSSLSQRLHLGKEYIYTFSAWVKLGQGNSPVTAVFKTVGGDVVASSVVAQSSCWSMMKGGLSVDMSGLSELHFESESNTVEILVASVSFQPFTKDQWKAHQEESIQKARKRVVRFRAVDDRGNTLSGANVSIKATKTNFPLGCAIGSTILNNAPYQSWFTQRFPATTISNEMKWYSTEKSPGVEDYSVPDAMIEFAKKNGISVRGHNILWDDPQYQPWWVKTQPADKLQAAATKRVNSVVSRYAGQLIAWDVMNENLHFNFFESKLGRNASASFFQQAHQLDPTTKMFMNEYNIIEYSGDTVSSPANYVKKLKEIQSYPGNQGPTAIGLEGHFVKPDLAYMRSALDTLASTNLPIWLTEVDVVPGPQQAELLEQILREAYAHPGVEGMIIWSVFLPAGGCTPMCLTDSNFKNTPTGDVVDKLLKEWKQSSVEGTTDAQGFFEASLFLGDYGITISHPALTASSTRSMKVAAEPMEEGTLHTKITA